MLVLTVIFIIWSAMRVQITTNMAIADFILTEEVFMNII